MGASSTTQGKVSQSLHSKLLPRNSIHFTLPATRSPGPEPATNAPHRRIGPDPDSPRGDFAFLEDSLRIGTSAPQKWMVQFCLLMHQKRRITHLVGHAEVIGY